jgi:hypothetical protein
MQKSDGMNYAPEGRPAPVVDPGEFPFAAVALDHGHIFGQCKGLTEAGGDLRYVFDPDPAKVAKFCDVFPSVQPMPSLEAVLEKPEIKLVAAAAVPNERCALGLRVMDAGKDYFTDKTPLTTLAQLDSARAKVAETGRKYAVYFSERLRPNVRCVGTHIAQGAIGRRKRDRPRPVAARHVAARWFGRGKAGGISAHRLNQFQRFLWTLAGRAGRQCFGRELSAQEYPSSRIGATRTSSRTTAHELFIDWLNPGGLRTWATGAFVGTDGY